MEDQDKKQKIYKLIMLVAITMFVTFMVTSISLGTFFIARESNGIILRNEKSSLIESLKEYDDIIDEYFLGEVNQEKMNEEAIRGYIKGLDDPYTEYISKEEMQEYKENIMGNFVGIGIYMIEDEETNRIAVVAPIEGSPAEKAGILPGDLIVKVDGVEYTGEDLSEATTKIKGEEGTNVNIEILRDEKLLSFDIKREKIITNPVTSKIVNGNIGYIELSSFDEDTSQQFKTKFEELQKQNIESLIIDLRYNGGGIVDEALNIADFIADKGSTLLITVDKEQNEEISEAKHEPIIKMPIVILINGETASASEILAGGMKDLGKATLIGTRTYGKGVIQDFLTLSDGTGIKITSAEYYTPNKLKINEIGIQPNQEVKLPEDVDYTVLGDEKKDIQLQKAIEHLSK